MRLLTTLDTKNRQCRFVYGDLLSGPNDFKQATSVYRELPKDTPDPAVLRLRLSNALMKQDESEQTAAELETARHLGATEKKIQHLILRSISRLVMILKQQYGQSV